MKETLHIYTRVSTMTQQEEGTSLNTQKELGIKKAQELGFDYKVWNEGGASSNYEDFKNRPLLLKLLSEIDGGNARHLWVYNNDRLSRNDITAQTIRIALQKNGVTLYTKDGTYDLNNPHDKMVKGIFDLLAQYDNSLRAERTRIGKLNRVKEGRWMGGPAPFGYKIEDKFLALCDNESFWVKNIYQWYADGKSIEWIKSELDKNGIKTRRQKGLWSLGSIQKILQNTHPSGYYNFTDSLIEETIKSECPSIVSQSLWNACQTRRKQIYERKGQRNRTQRFYLLRDLMYCGHCGHAMSGRIKEAKNEYLYYCPSRERAWVKSAPKEQDKWKRGQSCTMNRSMNIHLVDDLITTEIGAKGLYEKLSVMFKNNKEVSDDRSNVEQKIQLLKLKKRKDRFNKELANIIKSIAQVESAKILGQKDERISDGIIKNMNNCMNETEAKIEQVKAELAQLTNPYYLLKDAVSLPLEVTHYTSIKLFKNDKVKKQYLESVINRIDVYYDKETSEHKLIINSRVPLKPHQNVETIAEFNSKKKKVRAVTTIPMTTPQQHNNVTVE